jgi:hypothetical protein
MVFMVFFYKTQYDTEKTNSLRYDLKKVTKFSSEMMMHI